MSRLKRILVADDDARWQAALSREASARFRFVRTLEEALPLIDRRRRWDGAVFDRYLLEGTTPFPIGKLVSEAGFILAVAFKERFPDKPVCVCSGDPDTDDLPAHLRHLLTSGSCMFVSKADSEAAAMPLRFILRGQRSDPRLSVVLDHLMLEPNFFGLGLNLRSVIDAIRSHSRRRLPDKGGQ